LKGADAPQPRTKAKTSKLAVLSLVLGVLSLPFFLLAGIPAIVIGITSLVRITASGGRLKGRSIALAGVLAPIPATVVFVLLWSLDAPPIPSDYTVADLRSAAPEYAESFEILKSLIDEGYDVPGAPAIGLTEEDVDVSGEIRGVIQDGNAAEVSETLDFYANDIERAWARMQETRRVIKRLDAFAEIADLTKHDVDFKIMRVSNLIELARFYQLYGHLKLQQRDIQTFAGHLVELDSVYRKLCVNARMMVPKLACLICIKEDILTANTIVNDSQTSRSTVQLLAKHFVPLTDDELSLRNAVLSEYLTIKSALASIAAGSTPLLKPNSTLRFYKNCCDNLLNEGSYSGNRAGERLSVWPDFYPFDESGPDRESAMLSLPYRCYNPLGSLFIDVGDLSNATIYEKNTNISVQDDLLQIVLNKRLGKDVSLKARAYSDEYIVDLENKKVFSPGPDGKPGTKDDIKLPINPEVLGWGD
jgi:hypothetical protein